MSVPMIGLDDRANTRMTDPLTAHAAGDVAVAKVPTAVAVEHALQAAGRPIIADEVWRIARQELGYRVTPQRVRTVLAEEEGGPWERLEETGLTQYGNKAHLWRLKETL